MFRATIWAACSAFVLMAAPATAQSTDISSQRDAIFAQMVGDPANRDLMARYASLSVQMRDFEAAAATLERLVDLEPGNVTARVELAIAYFALGAYDVAEYHLAAAQRSGALTPDQAARVARYRNEVAERNDGTRYSGRLEVGYAFGEDDNSGAFVNAALDWRIDLGDAHVSQWVTEFAYAGYAADDDSFNERQSARLRTGPEFRLSGEAYGARLQPFIELNWFDGLEFTGRSAVSWEVGLAYQNPLDERFTVFAEANVGRTEFQDEFVFPEAFNFAEAQVGLTYRPNRDLRFRVTGALRQETDDDPFSDETADIARIRFGTSYAFDPVFLDVPNRWVVGSNSQFEMTDYAGVTTDETTLSAYLRAFVVEDIYVEVLGAYLMRDTDFGIGSNLEEDERIVTLQLGWEF